MQDTAETERQWETKVEYNSGSGQVAKLERTAQGYRVTDCHAAGYAHG